MNLENFGHVTHAQLEILEAMDLDGYTLRAVGEGYVLADEAGNREVAARDVCALIDADLVDSVTFGLTDEYYALADEEDSE